MMTYFIIGCVLAAVYLFGSAIHLIDLEADEFSYGPMDILVCFALIPIVIIILYPLVIMAMFFILITIIGKKG